jgi:hypothetical protein
METLTREMIKKALELGVIKVENDNITAVNSGVDGIGCIIGGYAFYFLGNDDENLTTEEYWKKYTIDDTADILYEVLKDDEAADDFCLGEEEYLYYAAVIKAGVENATRDVPDEEATDKITGEMIDKTIKALNNAIDLLDYDNPMSDPYKSLLEKVTEYTNLSKTGGIKLSGRETAFLENAFTQYEITRGRETVSLNHSLAK